MANQEFTVVLLVRQKRAWSQIVYVESDCRDGAIAEARRKLIDEYRITTSISEKTPIAVAAVFPGWIAEEKRQPSPGGFSGIRMHQAD